MAIIALIKKDLRLLRADKRGLVVNLVAPIAIASFIGTLFAPSSGPASKIDMGVVDLDGSERSQALVKALSAENSLAVVPLIEAEARQRIAKGKLSGALVLPKGLGEKLTFSTLFAAEKPKVLLLLDPSRDIEGQVISGLVDKVVMERIGTLMTDRDDMTKEFARLRDQTDGFGSTEQEHGRWRQFFSSGIDAFQNQPADEGKIKKDEPAGGFQMPVKVESEKVVGELGNFNSYTNAFAGMLVMYLLFVGQGGGAAVLEERRRGTWRRLRLAPVDRKALLLAKAASTGVLALIISAGVFGFGMLVFGIRIRGSLLGFGLLVFLSSLLAASFALMLSGLGRTENQIRGYGTLAILLLTFLGGAWFPVWMMPDWLKTFSVALPTRWMMDGLQAVTWRGLGLEAIWPCLLVVTGFTVLFSLVGLKTFRWDD